MLRTLSVAALVVVATSWLSGSCGGGSETQDLADGKGPAEIGSDFEGEETVDVSGDSGADGAVEDAPGDARQGDSADVPSDPCEWLGPECKAVVERGKFKIVYLHGTPYEMGVQHATLLKEQLIEGVAQIEGDLVLSTMKQLAIESGLLALAEERSLPEILEECQGMADGAADIGWDLENCLILNFGDVIVEFIQEGFPEAGNIQPACSQLVASGKATVDGATYHLRLLDWSAIQFMIDNPVVFVRQPEGKLPHMFVGFPGNLSPYQGMNAAGLVSASNEIDPLDNSVHDSVGVSHVQLQARLLAEAHDVEEAVAMVKSTDHMTLELFGMSDAKGGAIVEMAPAAVGVRGQAKGVVYGTNHFLAEETSLLDEEPAGKSSQLRFERLQQLVEPGGEMSFYGKLEPGVLVQIARDRVNPKNGEVSPETEFDDGKSLATNGALYAVVFDPAKLRFWVAAGALPVPSQTFVGFSLGELLGLPGYEGATPEDIL